MAAPTLNLSLTEDLERFIDAQVAEGGYATANDYVRALVEREKAMARAQGLFDEAEASPLGPPVDDAYWERQRERIRQRATRPTA